MSRLSRFIHFYTDEDDGNGGDTGVIKTVSGALVHITDALAKPFLKCEVTLEPIQDLHGQDAPYPAGGGKNLLNPSSKSFDGSNMYFYSQSGIVLKAGTYTLSYKGANNISGLYAMYYPNGSGNVALVYNNTKLTFTLTEDTKLFFNFYDANNQLTDDMSMYQLESGSSATPYAPYSNICPITGHTGASVVRTGKNLLDPQYYVITSNNIKPYQDNGYTLKANKTYTFSSSEFASGLYITKFGTNDSVALKYSDTSVTYTPTEDIIVYFNAYYATVPTGGLSQVKLQLELGSIATSYEPYTGTTYPISWQTEAGTVYGGTLDVTTGVLTVDREMITLSSQTSRLDFNDSNGQLRVTKLNAVSNTLENLCSHYKSYSGSFASLPNNSYMASGETLAIKDTNFTSKSAWETYLDAQVANDTPVQCIRKLQEQAVQTYQLTPTQITALLGENNIWSSGSEVEVQYKASAS